MDERSAIYEPMRHIGWVGDRPDDHELAWQPGVPIPPKWCDVVVSRQLSCGIAVDVERRGVAMYDFASWQPGVAWAATKGPVRSLAEVSDTAKPALIQRLRVVNTHLTLLHAACVSQLDESPAVSRVHERDLYRFDYPDDGGDGYWYRPLEDVLPGVVTVSDRNRFGTVPLPTFELSLDWLDAVIAANALIEFDLLNQVQMGLATYDYPGAVVAGWTVCELRVRQLGRGVPGGNANKVSDVCVALEAAGVLTSSTSVRLDGLRKRRNKWLHQGIEPPEEDAVEALELATELLRAIVPDLATRRPKRFLIL